MNALGTVESDALLRRARHALYERDAQPEYLLPDLKSILTML